MSSLQRRILEAAADVERLPKWAVRVNDAMTAGRYPQQTPDRVVSNHFPRGLANVEESRLARQGD